MILHIKGAYSVFDGICSIEELLEAYADEFTIEAASEEEAMKKLEDRQEEDDAKACKALEDVRNTDASAGKIAVMQIAIGMAPHYADFIVKA